MLASCRTNLANYFKVPLKTNLIKTRHEGYWRLSLFSLIPEGSLFCLYVVVCSRTISLTKREAGHASFLKKIRLQNNSRANLLHIWLLCPCRMETVVFTKKILTTSRHMVSINFLLLFFRMRLREWTDWAKFMNILGKYNVIHKSRLTENESSLSH